LDRIGTSKLFELLVLDDDDANTLSQGGEVDGIGDLDDIARMTVRELRAALRELRAESAEKDKLLEAKNKKLDQLTAQLEREKAGTPAEEWPWAPARRMLLDACEAVANLSQTELRRALVEIQTRAEAESSLPEDIEALQGQALSSVIQTLVVLQKEFRIAVDLEAIVMPPWMQEFKSAGTANKKA
jgi:signal transduction histidine kinase